MSTPNTPTQTTLSDATLSETELLSRMLLRDARAWREFHRRYDRLIFHCIHKVTGRFPSVSTEDVREIYGMFLLTLNKRDMHKLRHFDPARGNKLSSWLGLLATNCAWDYLRSLSRQPPCSSLADAESLGDPSSPYDDLLQKERWALVNDVLATFSKKDRDFVKLYFVDGLGAEQVAERMAISVKTVYSKKHKIRCRLQRALEPSAPAAA